MSPNSVGNPRRLAVTIHTWAWLAPERGGAGAKAYADPPVRSNRSVPCVALAQPRGPEICVEILSDTRLTRHLIPPTLMVDGGLERIPHPILKTKYLVFRNWRKMDGAALERISATAASWARSPCCVNTRGADAVFDDALEGTFSPR